MTGAPRRRERGAVLVLTAAALSALLAFTAIAVDLGYQRVARRDMQALADVVALDVVRIVDGRTEAEIVAGGGGKPSLAQAVAESVSRNDDTQGRAPEVTAVLGTVGDDHEFQPCPCGVPNAVRVTAATEVEYFFRPGDGGASRSAVAVRANTELARFRVGSSLVSVNPQTSSIIGQLLNAIVPGASVLSYEGLANATVTLDALGLALGIPLTALSPEELLNTNVGLNQLAVAMVTALQNSGGGVAAVNALNSLIGLGVPATQVNLGEILGVAAGQGGPALGTTVSIGTLLTSAIFAIDGDHAVSIPGTTLNIPGLASVGLRLTGIEAPREGGNEEGASATTSQVHLEVTPVFSFTTSGNQNICALPPSEQNVLAALLTGVLNLVVCLLGGVLNQVLRVEIVGSAPIGVDIAEVSVSQHIDCEHKQLTLTPTPAAVRLTTAVNLDIQAYLAGTRLPGAGGGPLVRLGIPANLVAQGGASPRTFTATGPGTPTSFGDLYTTFTPATARVGSNPLGLAGLLQVGPATLSVLGLNLSTLGNTVVGIVQPVLNTVLGQLDSLVLQPLAQLLGLNLGGSDLTPLWLRCDKSGIRLAG